jgi:hypothetical protein
MSGMIIGVFGSPGVTIRFVPSIPGPEVLLRPGTRKAFQGRPVPWEEEGRESWRGDPLDVILFARDVGVFHIPLARHFREGDEGRKEKFLPRVPEEGSRRGDGTRGGQRQHGLLAPWTV